MQQFKDYQKSKFKFKIERFEDCKLLKFANWKIELANRKCNM